MAYGGGHMRMLVPVAHELARRGAQVTLLPLTVGIRDARASGLPYRTLDDLTQGLADRERWISLGRSLVPCSGHPDVSDAETWLYHGIGLADAARETGLVEARARFAAEGRKMFHPVAFWEACLARIRPDLLIATSAPRSESAALRAAGRLGIPSLCVTDHFLVYEMDYARLPGHGDRITVLAPAVARRLAAAGRPAGDIVVTGNPAFDAIADPAFDAEARAIRQRIGAADRRVVLWPQQAETHLLPGRKMVSNADMATGLLRLLAETADTVLIVRPHPNHPSEVLPPDGERIFVEPAASIEALILAADIVVQQSSTVGLQAALCGKPVVTVANQGVPPLAEHGLAVDIPDAGGIAAACASGFAPDPEVLAAGKPGDAACRVADVAVSLLRDGCDR